MQLVYKLYELSSVGVCAWLRRRILDLMIGFIDTLYTVLVSTGKQRYRWSTHFTVYRYTHIRVLSDH
jgi:hypothetical protein